MWRGRVRTTIRWASAFVNLTLHSCSPAQAMDVVAPGVVGSACFDRRSVAPAVPRFYVASGDPDRLQQIVPGLTNSGPARTQPRRGPTLFEVVPSKHSREDRHGRIPTR
jgi:hypothetical protein